MILFIVFKLSWCIVRTTDYYSDYSLRNKTFVRGKKGADKKGSTKRAQGKRSQNKKGARSRCCVTVTFKVVISSDNRVLSQSFFFFFFVDT